jgi:hypothetical protein
MIGFEGRLQWRQYKPFKLRAKPLQRKKTKYYKTLATDRLCRPDPGPHPKFAIRSFVVRRTINEQVA